MAALDRRPLGSGRIQFTTEDLTLRTGAFTLRPFVYSFFQSPQTPLILGLPWLEKHNLCISWSERQFIQWSEFCLQNCLNHTLQNKQPEPCNASKLPGEYHDLIEAFSKTKASQFHQNTVSFLGYVISSGGVSMDERKVQSVVNWPRLLTVKELQRILGFANFYRRFIRNYSPIAALLTSMFKKGQQRLVWTPTAISAFQERKRGLPLLLFYITWTPN